MIISASLRMKRGVEFGAFLSARWTLDPQAAHQVKLIKLNRMANSFETQYQPLSGTMAEGIVPKLFGRNV